MAVPGFEPGSSGSQPLMLTTTLYHQITTTCLTSFFFVELAAYVTKIKAMYVHDLFCIESQARSIQQCPINSVGRVTPS